MNDYWAKYDNVLDPSARECYNKMGGRMTQPLTRLNIWHYAINKPEMFNRESVKAYKSLTSAFV